MNRSPGTHPKPERTDPERRRFARMFALAAAAAAAVAMPARSPAGAAPAPAHAGSGARAAAPDAAAGARALTFDDFIALGRVSDPQVSPDGRRVAFVVTWMDEEANRGNSDIWIAPLDGSEPARQLTRREGTDSQPRFSPDGRWIAFTSTRSGDAQVWVLPVDGGEARQVTRLSTGASSPVWLPDSRRLVVQSSVFPECATDSCNAARLAEKDNAPSRARLIEELFYVHWDSWRDERRGHLFLVDVDGATPRDLTPGPYEVPTIALGSAHDVAVSPEGTELCVTVNTDSNLAWSINNDLFLVPLDGSGWKRITTNPANDNHPVYSPDGRWIAYRAMSRPGFESDRYRVMLYDRRTGEIREAAAALADEFDRSPSEIVWSPDSKRLYATCADRGYRSIYSIDVRGGRVKQLTEQMYASSLRVTPDGRRLVFLRQSATHPSEVWTCDRNGRRARAVTHVNDARLAGIEMRPLESFTFAGAGGTPVHGWLLKPPGFDASRRYPLVFLVHGGPQGAWGDVFHWRWNYQMFAAPGYVVVAINPRGSTGYGQKFTDEISRDWGGKVYEDLMKGLDAVLRDHPYIDRDRIAAAGASYGGYMMAWFEGHTDRFRCIVDHDGVYNLESMYGATEELWFPEWEFGGPPWKNRTLYEKWSPHRFAANFRTPMLVIHGARDYRVPLTQAMELFTALQRQGVPSKFLYFPDEGHWVLKPANARVWWKTVLDFIGEYVGPTR